MAVRRMAQTQTEAYWRRDFEVRPEDIEAIYDAMLEDGRPRTLQELACQVIARHVRREAQAQRPEEAIPYKPRDHYPVGQQVFFPNLDHAVGKVVAERRGQNPRYGEFTVISVAFEGQDAVREFAADFQPAHPLNELVEEVISDEEELSAEELCERYGGVVEAGLQPALAENTEFVTHGDLWFLRGLLPEVHVGHLNLAEAVIDVAGHPLSSTEILQQLDLAAEAKPRAATFSLDRALEKDERFDNVGTVDTPRWFLYNLEPPAVAAKPERLQPRSLTSGDELVHRESLEIAQEIGDELDEVAPLHEAPRALETGSASFILNYPHRREGTLPLTREIAALFSSDLYTRIPVQFVDARTDRRWRGWILPADRYGWGLGEWYTEQGVPPGAPVELLLTSDQYTVAVQCDSRSRRSEWVKAPAVLDGRLSFEIRKGAHTCRYDRNLLLGEPSDPGALDALLVQYRAPGRTLCGVMLEVFPELAKLGSQGLVDARTLYAAINVVWRTGAIPLFAELAAHACFDPVGDGNWILDDSLVDVVYTTPEEMETRPRSRRADFIRDRVLRYGSPA